MHSDQSPYRELHDAVLERKPFTSAALSSWLERHGSEATWLAEFRARSGPRTPASEEELWRLYGVSRIIEMLNLSFQSGEADGSAWPGPCISLAAREPPADENSGMTLAERVEMVINRCFIQSTTNSEDLWPWDDRLEMAG